MGWRWLTGLGLTLVGVAVALSADPRPELLPSAGADRVSALPSAASGPRRGETVLREGSPLADERGVFVAAGERTAFASADGKRRFVVLENLTLERVAQVIDDAPTPPTWSVSGTVTEFRGTNYLLLQRAIVTSDIAAK